MTVENSNRRNRQTPARRAGNRIRDLLFPPQLYCISCGALIDGTRTYGLCDDCVTKFGWATGRTCAKCGKPLPAEERHPVCYDCREIAHTFDKGYTCASYGLYERLLISAFKERGRDYVGRFIADAMYDRLRQESERPAESQTERHAQSPGEPAGMFAWDILTAVPAGSWKVEKRGYDQTAVIAESLARRMGLAYRPLLARSRYTKSMRTLGAWERRANVRNAFRIAKGGEGAVSGKAILLIDDVYTTGSTLDACAAVLKAAGAVRVDVLTFAAGADRQPVFEEEEASQSDFPAEDSGARSDSSAEGLTAMQKVPYEFGTSSHESAIP